VLLHDRALFSYVPVTQVSAPPRDYQAQANVVSIVWIHSSIVDYDYDYDYDVRVLLLRGYDAHRFRHYPVTYILGGTVLWDPWLGSAIDVDASVATELTRLGAMREVIHVGDAGVPLPGDRSAAGLLRRHRRRRRRTRRPRRLGVPGSQLAVLGRSALRPRRGTRGAIAAPRGARRPG